MDADGPGRAARLGLLASAIAGRFVDVAASEPKTPGWTDGTTVFVDGAANREDQLRAVAVQASLLGAGALDPAILAKVARRPELCRRYLAVEGHRALAAHAAILPSAVIELIDWGLATRCNSPQESLALALSPEPLVGPPEAFGALRPRHVRPAAQGNGGTAGHTPRRTGAQAVRELDDGETNDTAAIHLLSSPVGGGGLIGRLLKRVLRDGRSPGAGAPGADAPTHRAGRRGRPSLPATLSTAEPPALETGTDPAHDGIAYPEWDTYRRRYRVAWCTVVEIVPPWEPFRPFVPKDPRALRPPLARLGLDLERRHRQLQGHDLDIDAAVEARTDTKACSAPDEAVYIDSLRRAHDLSALVLLDVSGSSAEPGTSGATVHDHQRSAAMALTLALSDLGDRVALYGFRSHGRASVQLLAVKRFNDPLDTRVLRRVGGLIPGGYTRLGAAIRHAGTVLERDGGTGRRLLVVLSDGRAYDHGYEGAYSEADCRRALSEVRRRGTGCLCLSVGASSDAQATARVFGTAAHATVPRPELLAGVVAPLFRSALQSAETMRRATQRTDRSRGRVRLDRTAP